MCDEPQGEREPGRPAAHRLTCAMYRSATTSWDFPAQHRPSSGIKHSEGSQQARVPHEADMSANAPNVRAAHKRDFTRADMCDEPLSERGAGKCAKVEAWSFFFAFSRPWRGSGYLHA